MMNTKIQSYFGKNIIAAFVLAVMMFPGVSFAYGAESRTSGSAEAEVSTTHSVETDTRDEDDDGDGVSDGTEENGDADADVNSEAGSRRSADHVKNMVTGEASVSGNAGASANVGVGAGARDGVTKEIDKASPKLRSSKEIDKSTPLLYQGLRVSGQLCAQSGDCDDEDEAASLETSQKMRVHVSGDVVRGWDPKHKEEVRERVQAAGEVNSANDFGIQVASAALQNENVKEIASDDEKTEVRYNTKLKLFGLFSINAQAVAHADANGEAKIDYPWYSFLSTKTDQSTMTNLAASLRAKHDAMIAVEEEGAPANRRKDTEESSQ